MKQVTESRCKIEIRTTPAQKQIIEQAAKAEGVTVSGFMLSRSFSSAQQILEDRSLFVLDESSWNNFVARVDRPAKANAQLKNLLQSPSVLERRRKSCG